MISRTIVRTGGLTALALMLTVRTVGPAQAGAESETRPAEEGAGKADAGASRTPANAADPHPAYYEFLLGKISRYQGDLGEAARHLTNAAVADDSSAIRTDLAETYLRMGELQKAVEEAGRATKMSPDDIDARRTLAEAYLATAFHGGDRQGATALAIAELKTIVRLAPADNEARAMLARLLLQEDRSEEALEQLTALRAGGADPVQTTLLIARAELRAGKMDEAESELRSVLTAAPRNYETLLLLSQLAEARKDWSAAAGYGRKLVEIHPTESSLKSKLGENLLRAEKTDEALSVLRDAIENDPSDSASRELLVQALRAAGRPGEALREIDRLLEHKPDDLRLLVEKGRIHESRSEFGEALDAYRRALASPASAPETAGAGAPSDTPLTPDQKLSLVLSIASLELELKDQAAALRTLEAIPADGSAAGRDAEILRIRAKAAAGRAREAADAAAAFLQAYQDDPRGPLIVLEARLAGASRSDAEKALGEFRPAERPPRYLVAAADLLRDARQESLAVDMLGTAIAAHPQDAQLHFVLGGIQERLGHYVESERHLERAIEIDPKNAQALNYLGYELADRGRELPRAEALIRRALDIDPVNGAYLDSLGWVLYRSGRLDESGVALERAADLVSGDGTVREHLGDLYLKKGDSARALVEWKKALALRPEDPKRLRTKILDIGRGRGSARE